MKYLALTFLLTLLAAAQDLSPYKKSFTAGPLELTVELDRTIANLDDSINLTLTAIAPDGYGIALPEPESTSASDSFIMSKPVISDRIQQDDGRFASKVSIALEPLIVRTPFSIPSMSATFTGKDGKKHTIDTENIPLDITIPTDEEIQKRLDAELLSSKHPVSRLAPPSIMPFVYSAAIVLLLLAAAFYAIRHIIRKRRELAAQPPPPLPPWIKAELELDELAAENLVEQGMFMEFYNRTQLILRTYIEERFDIHAPERTTQEFLEELRNTGPQLTSYSGQLKQFLTHCDMVRFAAHIPEIHEINAMFNSCRDFVQATKPVDIINGEKEK